MLSVNPPTQCSGTPSDTRLSVNPFVVAPRLLGAVRVQRLHGRLPLRVDGGHLARGRALTLPCAADDALQTTRPLLGGDSP